MAKERDRFGKKWMAVSLWSMKQYHQAKKVDDYRRYQGVLGPYIPSMIHHMSTAGPLIQGDIFGKGGGHIWQWRGRIWQRSGTDLQEMDGC